MANVASDETHDEKAADSFEVALLPGDVIILYVRSAS